MNYRIEIEEHAFQCSEEQTVLLAMRKNGFAYLPVGCCAGGCGICKVKVLKGKYDTKVMSRAQVTVEEAAKGIALACRILPKSDLTLTRVISK